MNETQIESHTPAPVPANEERKTPTRVSRYFPVAEALMAAAHSGEQPAAIRKSEVVRQVMCDFLEVDHLPDRLEQRLHAFDPKGVDVKKLAEELLESPVAGRRT